MYIRAYAEQTVTERTDVYRSTRFFAPKMFFRSFKVTNANIETKLEQMCCIHTRLVVCAQEHNDFSGGVRHNCPRRVINGIFCIFFWLCVEIACKISHCQPFGFSPYVVKYVLNHQTLNILYVFQ